MEVALSRELQRLPGVAQPNHAELVRAAREFVVEELLGEDRLREVGGPIDLHAQLCDRELRRGARLELPVEKHRPADRTHDEAHPEEREEKKARRKTSEELRNLHGGRKSELEKAAGSWPHAGIRLPSVYNNVGASSTTSSLRPAEPLSPEPDVCCGSEETGGSASIRSAFQEISRVFPRRARCMMCA